MKANELAPEWCDARQAQRIFNLGRTTLTRLSREGKIRACSLAEPGMKRGKKLYRVSTIRTYLEARAMATAETTCPR